MSESLLESLLGDAPRAGDDRAEVVNALLRDGLPTARDEAWKYTSVKALGQRAMRNGDPSATTRELVREDIALPGVDSTRLVFVNGVFRADVSHLENEAGVEIVADARFTARRASAGEPVATDATAGTREFAFALLNDALLDHGVRIRVDGGVRAKHRVHVVFAGVAVDVPTAVQLRVAIELASGASLDVIEHHVACAIDGQGSNGDSPVTLVNGVLDVRLAEGAALTLTQFQEAGATATVIRRSGFVLDAGAKLSLSTIDLGAQTMRHDVVVDLAGDGARFNARGVFALRGRQHADTHLVVTHAARDTACDIVSRGVADGRSRGVFHGAITVAAGADGADAKLRSNNLLLSANAEIDTQPVLEIYADEVKAAHGATVGQLDEVALFYLRSRGIDRDGARRMLITAFCESVIADLKPPALREHVARMIAQRVSAGDPS